MTITDLPKQLRYAVGIGASAIAAGLIAISQHKPLDCSLRARCQRTIEAAGSELRCVLKYDGAERAKRCLEAKALGGECARSAKASECSDAIDAAYLTEVPMCPATVDVAACRQWAGFDDDGIIRATDGDGK